MSTEQLGQVEVPAHAQAVGGMAILGESSVTARTRATEDIATAVWRSIASSAVADQRARLGLSPPAPDAAGRTE
jgi:hypothetical protein